MSAIIAVVLAGISALVLGFSVEGFWADQYVGVVLVLSVLLLVFVVTPIRMGMEKVRLTTKRLTVTEVNTYDDGKGCHWLRVKVENPTALPIRECYGKLLDRKHVLGGLTKVDGVLVRQELSSEHGRQSRQHMELPPEGYRFPWSPERLPPAIITIPGFGSPEFLYIVAKRENVGPFGFPTDMGIQYDNLALGDFQLDVEIGSELDSFKPVRFRVVFRTEGDDLELIRWSVLN